MCGVIIYFISELEEQSLYVLKLCLLLSSYHNLGILIFINEIRVNSRPKKRKENE
jgi:hypothetical protein